MMEADKAKYGYDARQERDFLAQQEKGKAESTNEKDKTDKP